MKRIVVLWILLFGLLPLARAQAFAVSGELSLAQKQLLPDEKMHLKLTVQNRSGQDLKLGTESDWLTFTVMGEKNEAVAPLGTNHVYIEGETTVPAGNSASREFNLTPFFDFRQPGRYSVKATIRIPEWGGVVEVPPASFTIVKGIRLASLDDLEVGVPLLQREPNQPPEMRKYKFEKSDAMGSMRLYVRLTDATGSQTLRLIPVGPLFSFSEPEVRLDRYNDLHVLHQTDAKKFNYCVIDTLGQILERQTWQYTDQRPGLRADAEGGVSVAGGARIVSDSDLPPPQKAVPALPVSFPGSKPEKPKAN